jgi:hypothetical protein
MKSIEDAPYELANAIREFFPEAEHDHAASVAFLESGWDPFALHDSTDSRHPCGSVIGTLDGTNISAELSVGFFQINSCNFPNWEWQRLYNARHNVGTAHMLWSERGWQPWFFSAKALGL